MERAPSFHEVWRYLHISQEGRAIVSGVEEMWRSAGEAETQLRTNVTETLQAYVRDGATVAALICFC